MPEPIRFLGLTMKNFSSQQAWGNSPATLSVTLVPDYRNNDEFIYENNGQIGIFSCHTFTAGSFRFRGFLTNWEKERSQSGNPIYNVTLTDGREVLAGTQVVIAKYYGRTDIAPNVINAFGYWENVLGFGNSLSNEGGMPWQLIKRALNDIINNNASPIYGGRLRYRNEYFTVDLSQIPVPPLFYKLQGNPSISLLECIQQVCDDCARDWYVEMSDTNVITIKTISRKLQLAYNQKSINQYANSIQQAKNINSGWEGINDRVTSKLLIGSNVSYMYHSTQIGMYPYWGTDISGNYIYSNDLEDETVVNLNSSICADILGSTTYSTTIGEIRIAMYSEQAWLNYISIKKPTLAGQLGIPIFYSQRAIDALNSGNFSQAGPNQLLASANEAAARFYNSIIGADNNQYEKIKRIHQMIAQAGQNFMGRSFLVYLPFIVSGYDPETAEIFFNYVIDQEGGYVAWGENLLGMNELNKLLFESSPGRIGPFATYDISNVDSMQVANPNCVVQANGIYVKCGIETEVKLLPFPCALIHLANPLTETKSTVYFSPIIDWINIVHNGAIDEPLYKTMLKNNLGVFPVGIGAISKPKIPQYLSIPLRSKVETYGGTAFGRGYWLLAGIPGKTEVEQDDNLNPWSYGGYIGMDLAAIAKLFQVSTQAYAVEFGSLSFPGLPNHSLGQELYYQGSNITSIDVSVSEQGYTTNYRLRAFDPNIMGSMAKREEARFQRIGKTLARLRLEAKETYERIFMNVGALHNSSMLNYSIHPTLAPRTPHSVIGAKTWTYDDNKSFHEMAFMTPTEALANINTRDADSFKNFSMMGINGLLRPYTTNVDRTDMPKYITPVSGIDLSTTNYNTFSMNPLRANNDILLYSKGDMLTEDIRTIDFDPENNNLLYENQGDYENLRGIGIKTPINFVGYGFNLHCKSVVTNSGQITSDDRQKSQSWKAGPFDPIFDQVRGCWTFHDMLCGQAISNIAARNGSNWSSGGVRLLGEDNLALDTIIPVYNIHNAQVTSGKMVTITYHAQSNRFVIQSADC